MAYTGAVESLNWVIGGLNVACALVCFGLARPLVRRRVKPNHYYGVRFAKSFESEQLWYDINEFGGRRLIVWSIPLGVSGLLAWTLPLSEAALVALAFAPLLLVVGCVETYLYARRQ